jgi:hypothetical protein
VVLVGILGAVATVLAALLTAYREELASLIRNRRASRNFGGRWSGDNVPIQTFDSSDPLDAIRYELKAQIKQSGRHLKGHVSVTRPGGDTYNEAFTGEIVSDSCACVIFYSNDRDVSDYGTAMLQLDGYGTNIAGYVLGNRTAGHGFVLSNMKLRKDFPD